MANTRPLQDILKEEAKFLPELIIPSYPIATKSTADTPGWAIEISGNRDNPLANQAQYSGACRLIILEANTPVPDLNIAVTGSVVYGIDKTTKARREIIVMEVQRRIPKEDYVSEAAYHNATRVTKGFVTVVMFITDFDAVMLQNVDLTPIGKIMLEHNQNEIQVISEMPTTMQRLMYLTHRDICIQAARYFMTIKAGNMIEIATLDTNLVMPVIIGITSSMNGWANYTEAIFKAMSDHGDLFFQGYSLPSDFLAIKQYFIKHSLVDEDGKMFQPNQAMLLMLLWYILQGSLRHYDQAKLNEASRKRFAAIASMTGMETTYAFSSSGENVTTLHLANPALTSILPQLISPLISQKPEEDHLVTQVRVYLATILSGYKMASFLVIQDFLRTSYKCVAHVNTTIINEIKLYYNMRQNATNACGEHPIEMYSLLFPTMPHIDTSKLKALRFCSAYYKKRDPTSTWAQFAPLDRITGIDPTELKKLVDTPLRLEQVHMVPLDDIGVIRGLGIPVSNDGRVIEQESDVNAMSLLRQFLQPSMIRLNQPQAAQEQPAQQQRE